MPLRFPVVFFLTRLTRTLFLTRTKSLSLPTLISLVFVNRKNTRTLLILSTESIKSPSRQWSGRHPRGRTSSWSKGSSSIVSSQRRSPRPQSRKCLTSSLLPTTFTCTPSPPPASTNEVIPLRMHSHTSIANYCHIQGLVEVCAFHPTLPRSYADFGDRFRRLWTISCQWIRGKEITSRKFFSQRQGVVRQLSSNL